MIEAIITNVIIIYIFYKYIMRLMFTQTKADIYTLNKLNFIDKSNENQVKQDKEIEIKYLKEKNEKLFKVIFKFLVSFEKEIDEYIFQEDAYKIKEEKYISEREEFKFLSLE